MSDLRREVDDIGRRIWPDPPAAYRAMHSRRRRWWVSLLQPRRPQLAMRWLPVLAAVATVAIFVTLAGARPALERTQGQGQHTVQPRPVSPPGALDSRGVAPEPGHAVGGGQPQVSHPAASAPPPAPAPAVANNGSPASPQRPPSSGSGVVTVTLTEADAGHTITVAPGTRIVVTLQGSPRRQWTAPRALDSSVVSTSDSGRDAAGGGAHGTFVAAHPGRTRLVAGQGGCHGPLCLIASTSTWQVHIVVS